MKIADIRRFIAALAVTAAILQEPVLARASTATQSSSTLANGIRVVSVYFPGSTNVSIFTFLPLGLVSDGPHQTQWSHLVEHLVIRSTIPGDLSVANAETSPEGMRLDFYGNIGNWKQGLTHHQRWLDGVPFTRKNLKAEKPNVKSEGDTVAQNFFTHKFALAAWAQGFRHDQTNAAVQGDIDRATLHDIQAYRDSHLVVLTNVVVCVVGGVDPGEVQAAVVRQLGAIKPSATPVAPVKLHPGNREMTWDLQARHLVMTWPIPAAGDGDFAPLMVGAECLDTQLLQDVELKGSTGAVFAGTDLTTPEGNFFYLSASLLPGASFTDVRQKLERQLRLLNAADQDWSTLPMLRQQLAESLTTIPDLASVKAQMPADVAPAMLEGQIGLQWGMNEYLYGPNKIALAKRISEVTPQKVQRAVSRYLSDSKASVITLSPSAP